MGAVLADDPTAQPQFEDHFRELVGPIRRYASRSIGHVHADDIVSETFIVVWRKWADAPLRRGTPRAWTFKIAHNMIAHHVRSQLRRGQLIAGRRACDWLTNRTQLT